MEIGRKFEGIEASSEGFFSTVVTMAIFKLDGITPSSKDLLNSDTSQGQIFVSDSEDVWCHADKRRV